MTHHAYIYDAVRTPRSKGKNTGSLYEVKPIDLAAGLLRGLQTRHDLDTSYVDDVVMGCVTPVGEQGCNVAKMIVQNADWHESVPGVQLHGGAGYMHEYPICRMYTDARVNRIYAGSSEIMKMIIGRDIFSENHTSIFD